MLDSFPCVAVESAQIKRLCIECCSCALSSPSACFLMLLLFPCLVYFVEDVIFSVSLCGVCHVYDNKTVASFCAFSLPNKERHYGWLTYSAFWMNSVYTVFYWNLDCFEIFLFSNYENLWYSVLTWKKFKTMTQIWLNRLILFYLVLTWLKNNKREIHLLKIKTSELLHLGALKPELWH